MPHADADADAAAARAWEHLRAELADDLEATIGTISTDEVVFVGNRMSTDPVEAATIDTWTSHASIRERYTGRAARTTTLDALVELRGSWWMFLDCVAQAENRTTGATTEVRAATLFPALDPARPINGEIYLYDSTGAATPTDEVRRDRARTVRRFIAAVVNGDPGALRACLADDATTVARSYLPGTGPLAEVRGGDQFAERFTALLERTSVVDVDVSTFLTGGWYVFAECRWTFQSRTDPALRSRGTTAELFSFATDGRINARLGYGTTPVALD